MTPSGATGDGMDVSGLSVTYRNGATGCHEVSFEVKPDEILAVLGRNGVGKTTLLRGIAGFRAVEGVHVRGQVSLNGKPLSRNPGKAHKAGVVFVPERDKVFPSLTVQEHFKLVNVRTREAIEQYGFPSLSSRWTSKAGLLSGGERQMLALATAWAQQPRLLLVDELSLGLAPVIVAQLLQKLREMAERSHMSVILVDQDAVAALRVADSLLVLDHGEIVWRGASRDTSAAELGAHFLGTAV
jgi:ABC-type branched-subunit amino acid transport system ATPase component